MHCCNSYLREGGSRMGGGGFCSKLLLGNTCGISSPAPWNARTNWQRSWSEMSVLSSQEFEECGACFYLSSRVYQRVLKESTKALLLPEQRVFRMQARVSTASVLSSVCLAVFPALSFVLSLTLPFKMFLPLFSLPHFLCPPILHTHTHTQWLNY